MTRLVTRRLAAAIGLALATGLAQAAFVDAGNDYVPGFTGGTAGDLDVLKAEVVYQPNTNTFTLKATMAAAIGSTASGFYIWGFDRGQGTPRFAANGFGGVLFDSVVRINPNGSGAVTNLLTGPPTTTTFGAGTATVSGASFSLDIAASLLPSAGFAPSAYTWNLWPRDSNVAGNFQQISDFAPDNSNQAVTVPEPGSLLLVAMGLAGAAAVRRRRG